MGRWRIRQVADAALRAVPDSRRPVVRCRPDKASACFMGDNMAGSDATADIHLETTLPGASYCDPAVLEREWDRIFNRSWICAGREERAAVPGQYFTLA